MWQFGFAKKWKKEIEPLKVEVCLAKGGTTSRIKEKSIKLVDLASAFLVLGVGALVSLIAFLSELIFCSTRRVK